MPVIREKKIQAIKKLTAQCALDPVKMNTPACSANGENTQSGNTL